jgi:hypothetical protein
MCLRNVRDEAKYCSHVAGYGTDHVGEGRCKFHHGAVTGRPPEHGRYADVAKRKLRREYERYANDPDMLNLGPELALQRALLTELVVKYQDTDGNVAILNKMTALLGDITATVNRIEKIQSQQVLTRATARLIMLKAMEVAQGFIPEEDLPVFVETWRSQVLEGRLLLEGDVNDA